MTKFTQDAWTAESVMCFFHKIILEIRHYVEIISKFQKSVDN